MNLRREISKYICGNNMLRAGVLILILTLWSMCGICGVWAKYVVTDSFEDSARVASMYFAGDVYGIDVSSISIPGDYVEETVSLHGKAEVSSEYRFAAEIDGSMPLTVTVTKKNTSTGEETTLLSSSISGLNAAIAAQAAGDDDAMPYIVLGSTETVDPNTDIAAATSGYTYTVRVEWPSDQTDLNYPYGRSVVTIGTYAEQID